MAGDGELVLRPERLFLGEEKPASRTAGRGCHLMEFLAANQKLPDNAGRLQMAIFERLFLLFFQGNGDRADGGEPHLVAFNPCNQASLDIVVMALVRSFSAVLFGQLDPVALDLVDGADVNAVGADDFHVLLDIGHGLQLP